MAHRVVRADFERRDARGLFREIARGFPVAGVLWGRMEAGAVMGNHYHRETRVFFYLTEGEARVATVDVTTGGRDRFELREGDGVLLEPKVSHAIRFVRPSEFVMLKSRAYSEADPDTYPHPVDEA
jgi:quercetin dioxygenase-like cupin family protein